jgi:hypothetical protein
MSKKEKGLFEKIKHDVFTGVERIITSLREGVSLIQDKMSIILKFTFFSFIISLFFGLMPFEYSNYIIGGFLFTFSFLILLFHHDLFNRPIKNKKRFVKNVIYIFILLGLMALLFTLSPDPDPEVSASHPLRIVTSSIAFLLLILLLFQAIYLVKAGAGPKIALKSTINFLGKFGMSAMFYVLLLVFMFGLSTLPIMFGELFIIFSVFLFFASIFMMFILLYVFWKNAKG